MASGDTRNPFGMEAAKQRRRRLLWVAGALLVCLVLFFAAPPTYRMVKSWRAEGLAEEALALQAAGEPIGEVWQTVLAGQALDPLNLTVLRAQAAIFSEVDPAGSLPFWQKVADLGGDSEADRLGLLKAAFAARQLALLDERLPAFREAYPANREADLLAARKLLPQQRPERALALLETLVAQPEAPQDAHFLYVQLTQALPDPATRRAGLDHLLGLTEREDALGLEALRSLARLEHPDADIHRLVAKRLPRHPEAERPDRLAVIEQAVRIDRLDTDGAVRKARSLFALEEPVELAAFGRWLNSRGLHKRTLEVVGRSAALQRRDLFLIWMDALAVNGDWATIREMLDRDYLPVREDIRQLFLARYYLETGDAQRAELGWNRVFLEIGQDADRLWFFHRYARQLGLTGVARKALVRLTGIPPEMRKAYQGLIALETRAGSTRSLRDVLRNMARDYPGDAEVQNDLAYLNLLLEEEVIPATEEARQVVRRAPDLMAPRITLALGHLRQDQAAKALAVFAGTQFNYQEMRASWKVVLGAVLSANGRDAQAAEILSGVDSQNLLTEEATLLKRATGG
ncbi:MAG: hypothetical protein ACFE0O_06160 [Opitutales bacterium]